MSTITKEFTKEQLIEKLKHRITVASEFPESEKAQMDLELARIALASLEAEPDYMRYDCGCCGWETIEDWRENDVCPKCNHHPMGKTPLYTAPQPLTTSERAELENYRNAQQVVPDKLSREEYKRRFMEEDNFDDTFRGGWNSCRAAMQSGAVKDGWVACSERLPDETNDPDGGDTCYLVLYAEGRQPNGGSNVQVSNVTYLRRWHDGMITHWQPLPAAPQQESE